MLETIEFLYELALGLVLWDREPQDWSGLQNLDPIPQVLIGPQSKMGLVFLATEAKVGSCTLCKQYASCKVVGLNIRIACCILSLNPLKKQVTAYEVGNSTLLSRESKCS